MNNPSAPPPAYSIQRPIQALADTRNGSVRIVVVIAAIAGAIWSIIAAVRSLRYLSSSTETSRMRITDIISAVLYLIIGAIEILGLAACFKQSRRAVKMYSAGALIVILLAFIAGVVNIVAEIAFKSDLKAACVTAATTTGVSSSWWGSSSTVLGSEDAQDYCASRWSRTIWSDVIWLCATTIIAAVIAMFAVGYARQLAQAAVFSQANEVHENDPSLGVPLTAYQGRVPEYAPPTAPPYPGPPASGSSHDIDSKQSFVAASAEDEAWNQSLAESERREWQQHQENQEAERAYMIAHGGAAHANEEEDEAWERSRRQAGFGESGRSTRTNEDQGGVV
ncbi:hypothetical protein [Phaffia rhodozyma]|uniref:Uncharacterized protein n=1 Tax=Phaffia rhodozyma TaxID=264483 RepID=A0A0F7SW72_PHARH|nr:hypothetical protein [Phaffia rhodozyma]